MSHGFRSRGRNPRRKISAKPRQAHWSGWRRRRSGLRCSGACDALVRRCVAHRRAAALLADEGEGSLARVAAHLLACGPARVAGSSGGWGTRHTTRLLGAPLRSPRVTFVGRWPSRRRRLIALRRCSRGGWRSGAPDSRMRSRTSSRPLPRLARITTHWSARAVGWHVRTTWPSRPSGPRLVMP